MITTLPLILPPSTLIATLLADAVSAPIVYDWLTDHGGTWEDVLRIIVTHPREDGPRLLAAEWCERSSRSIRMCTRCKKSRLVTSHLQAEGWDDCPVCPICSGSGRERNEQAERGEFLKCQLRLQSLDGINTGPAGGAAGPEHLRLRRCEEELLTDGNRQNWFAVDGLGVQLEGDGSHLFWWVQSNGPRIQAIIRRGFVEAVRCRLADWVGHGPLIVASQPIVELVLTDLRVLHHSREPGFAGWKAEGLWDRVHYEHIEAEARVSACRYYLDWARRQANLPPLPAASF